MYGKDQRLEIGRRLQQIRGSRDQRTFAEAVGSVQQTISKYERGEIPRSWLFLSRLAEQENVDLNALLVGFATRVGESGEETARSHERNGYDAGRERVEGEEEESFASGGERIPARF